MFGAQFIDLPFLDPIGHWGGEKPRDQIGHPGPRGKLLDEDLEYLEHRSDEKDGKQSPV
jgi:hypothetical protein